MITDMARMGGIRIAHRVLVGSVQLEDREYDGRTMDNGTLVVRMEIALNHLCLFWNFCVESVVS